MFEARPVVRLAFLVLLWVALVVTLTLVLPAEDRLNIGAVALTAWVALVFGLQGEDPNSRKD